MARDIDTTGNYHDSASLPPETIERRLGKLIRYYVWTRSPAIAQSVVRHIEQLCAHHGSAKEIDLQVEHVGLNTDQCSPGARCRREVVGRPGCPTGRSGREIAGGCRAHVR